MSGRNQIGLLHTARIRLLATLHFLARTSGAEAKTNSGRHDHTHFNLSLEVCRRSAPVTKNRSNSKSRQNRVSGSPTNIGLASQLSEGQPSNSACTPEQSIRPLVCPRYRRCGPACRSVTSTKKPNESVEHVSTGPSIMSTVHQE